MQMEDSLNQRLYGQTGDFEYDRSISSMQVTRNIVEVGTISGLSLVSVLKLDLLRTYDGRMESAIYRDVCSG